MIDGHDVEPLADAASSHHDAAVQVQHDAPVQVQHDAPVQVQHDAPVVHDAPSPATCASWVPPTPCDTENGLNVYCVTAGSTITMKGQTSYPANPSVAALGVGSVNGMTSLGYFSAADPFTCVPTECDHAIGDGNSGASGKICEVSFDLSVSMTTIGSGMFTIAIDPAATNGDYLVGYAANWTVLTPDFYLRVGSAGQ